MSLEKVLKKILSVTLAVAFVLQQGGFAFAAIDVSTWDGLQAGIGLIPGEYNVTTDLTADENPDGTLYVLTDGYSVTGASLTQNSTGDTLIHVADTVYTGFGLANDIVGTIVNNGILNYSGSSLSGGDVVGIGSIYFTGTTTNYNAITQASITVKNGATLTNNALLTGAISTEAGGTLIIDPDNLGNDVANKGILKLNADGTLAVAITDAAGSTQINANVVVDDTTGSISQDTIRINTGHTLTSNASNLTTATEISNDGSLVLTGGTNANAINGVGDVTFSGTGTITNNGAIDQQTGGVVNDSSRLYNNALITAEITNNLNKNITSLADNLNGKVHNNGVLYLTGNATQDAIDGTGNLFIFGDTTNAYNIDQAWLTASGADFGNSGIVSVQNLETDATGSVTNTNNISVTHDVINAGAIDNQAGAMFDNSASTGVIKNNGGSITNAGTFNAYTINNNAGGYFSNSGSLSFNSVDNASGAMFYQDAGSMNTTGTTATFDNSGTFMLDGGDAYVASLTNRAGADVTLNGGQLTAETLLNKSDIYNDATLNTVNFTNDGTVTGSGTTNITGDSTNNGSITQGLVAISNNSTFTNNGMLLAKASNAAGSTIDSDPDNLGGDVVNDGTLNLNAAGTLTVDVTGAGETNIGGDLTNNGSISQKDVNVAAGVVVTTNASDITATNVIDNSGIINYTGGTTGNTITGTGRIDITGYVTNTGDITQTTVSNSGVFTNDGTVTANLKNTNAIEGTGDIITGTGFSTNSGTIEQASITNNGTFDNNGHIALTGTLTNNSTFTTNADLLAAAGGVVNDGALNITGGTNTNVVTGTGTTNFTNDVINNVAITQALVNNSGNLTNNALITSDIVNSGTLRTDGGNIVGDVDNTGSYVLTGGDIAGTITGTGTTSIFGNTTNNGNITQEKVTVGNSANFITASDTITAAIENQGTMLWNGGSSNSNVVTGNGGLVVTGTDILNTASISQDQITVAGGSSLTTDANLLNATNGITNNGDLIFLDGTNNNTVSGVGDLSIMGNVTNNAAVEQNSVYIGLGQLTTNADLLATTNGITNDADLILTGGTNANDISGTGTTTIDGTVTNGADISTDILVSATGNFSTLTDITSTVENRNVVQLIDADITSTGKIKGSGTTNILGDTVNNGTITGNNVNIAAGASLTTDSDKVTAAINNEGDLTWTAGTGNTNAITGKGSLEITGGDITNTASISQDNITINGGSLTSDADLLASASGITNNADLVFTGGTNTNVISGTGDLEMTGDVTSTAAINQNTVTVTSGTFTTNADLLTAAGGVTNNSNVSLTGGTNTNTITGTGTTFIDGTVENAGTIDTNLGVGTSGHYATTSDITKALANNGITDITNADINAAITGTGTTNILGTTTNNSTIAQGNLNIASSGALTTDIDDVTAAIGNEGSLTISGGSANANVITGKGSLEITGGDIANTASISQDNITITGGSLTSDADLLATVGGITNNATFGLTGGTNTNNITGTGALETSNDVTNEAVITQATVTNSGTLTNAGTITADVTNTGVLISEGDTITGDITNNGTYAIVNDDNANDIIGTGDLQIQGTTTNTGAVSQDNINVLSGATFVASNIGDIATTTGIDNAGTFEMQSGTNTNVITGNTGALKVTGAVTNTSGVSINQDTLDIATLGSFTVDAGDITTVDGITNSGALTFGDGATANNISGNGTLTVNGTVTNTGNISQKSLTNTGDFTSDASLLAFADGITNSNTLTLTGGTNNNAITGAGTTDFTGDVTNNGAINQSSVSNTATLTNNAAITASSVVNSGTINNEAAITGPITNTGTINSTADNLVGVVTNNNTLNLAGGEVQNTINGSGNTVITDDLVNSQNIIQATVTNNAHMTNSGAITADFTNNGDVDNSADITGAITNNGNLTSAADHLVGAVNNSGTLNVEGGTMQDVVTGTGTMNIITDLTSSYAITQDAVTNDGVFTNNATVTATTISNTGTIIGKASDLVASSGIDNDGTLVFNAASTGASDISGDGDVQVTADTTLAGSNSFTGGTLIDGATLTVAGASNLSSGDVSFANSGILDVTAAATLDNVLKGDAATDDITVNHAGALTLNTATGVANDFHKTGAGTMTFAMTSNGYTGNTYVDGGTLIGNTQNINNTVNGAAGTTVEFNDTADADLNAINTLGNFVQSGSAVLNVKNNAFTAAQADINAGTFAANRALTATTLNVNSGATLRGNGNITGTVNVNGGGTIAPGNSIDTLTVTGDLNLASGSTTAIEINETPASDKLIVTGATNIAGGANLTVSNENGRYFEWESFDILESAGNVTGTFTYDGTITDYDASRIEVGVDYSDPTKVVLTAKRKATDYANSSIVAGGLPRNASEAARAADAVSTGFGGDITNALLQLEKLGGLNPADVTLINPDATLLSALNDLHGVLYANSALTTLFNAKTAHVYDRIAKRNPSAGKCTTCHDNVWAEYYSQYDKAYADGNSPRFTNNMTGVLVGYDRSSDDVLLGVYAGFGKSDLRQNNSKMEVEDSTLGVYGGYMMGDWLFKGTLFGGVQHYHGTRSIAFMGRTAEGYYDGVSAGLDLEASYNIPVYSWLNVKPFAGWLNNYSHQQAFAEKGADSLNLHVNGNDQFNSQARLGVQLDGKIKNRFSWYGSVAVKQFVGDDYAKLHMNLGLNNTDMEIISAELGRTYFSGQVGANYAITNNWSIFANLDTGLSNKSANCYGNIGVAYTW